MTRVEIDLNVRVRGQLTVAGIEDADGPIIVGTLVVAYESESGASARAIVTEVDHDKRLVYLAVAWREMVGGS